MSIQPKLQKVDLVQSLFQNAFEKAILIQKATSNTDIDSQNPLCYQLGPFGGQDQIRAKTLNKEKYKRIINFTQSTILMKNNEYDGDEDWKNKSLNAQINIHNQQQELQPVIKIQYCSKPQINMEQLNINSKNTIKKKSPLKTQFPKRLVTISEEQHSTRKSHTQTSQDYHQSQKKQIQNNKIKQVSQEKIYQNAPKLQTALKRQKILMEDSTRNKHKLQRKVKPQDCGCAIM